MPDYFYRNLPNGLIFIVQHSFFTVKRLRRYGLSPGAARLFHCWASAVTLHWFMANYVSIGAKPLLVLPISAKLHFYFASTCLIFAIFCYLSAPETWAMLGTA